MAIGNLTMTPCQGNATNETCLSSETSTPWQQQAISVMRTYVILLIFILGLVNNTLAIAVFQTKSYRRTSTGFLMTMLALADIGVLCTSATQIWIQYLVGVDVRLFSHYSCKFNLFFTYFFVHLSAWSLTLVTIERVVCVCKPLRVKVVFSFSRSAAGWAAMATILVALNLHLLWTTKLYYVTDYDSLICTGVLEYRNFLKVWVLIDLIISSLCPFAVILSCNVVIITQIARHTAWRRKTSSNDQQENRQSSTTTMLIVNSLAFVILTAPATVEIVWISYGSVNRNNANIQFQLYLFHMLFNLNSCLNFVLYSVSSRKFRRALVGLFSLPSVTRPTDSSDTVQSRCSLTAVSKSYEIRPQTSAVPGETIKLDRFDAVVITNNIVSSQATF